jgi:outer membrane protein TolC
MTRLGPLLSRKAKALAIFAFLPFITSCHSAMMSSFWPQIPATSPGQSLATALNPFVAEDHVRFTAVNIPRVLAASRARPPALTIGKNCLALEECRSMALANNLEIQIARVDVLTKEAVKNSSLARGLPHFLFSSELSERDNPPYSYSDILGQEGLVPDPGSGGTGVTNYSTSHERSTWRYVLETRWSSIDAVLAYYLSRNAQNDRFRSHYQKVRVAQKLVAVVDGAYFRLLSLQESLPYAKQLVSIRTRIADSMRRLRNKTIIRVEDYDRADQKSIEARRVLAKIRNEMERQRNILASAMGIPPESCMDGGLSVTGKMCAPKFSAQLCDLEVVAVKNRPEAYQAGLDHLNSVNDIKRTVVRYLPKVEGFWRYTRDKDKYLYNKDWKEVGVLIQVDLLDWLITGNESKVARTAADKTYKELGAVALGITSQVRVAALAYDDSLDELETRGASMAGSEKVQEIARMRASGDDLSQLELDEAEGNLLYQKLQRIRAIGEANATLAELQSALGTNYKEPHPCVR